MVVTTVVQHAIRPDWASQSYMASLVKMMLELHKRLRDSKTLLQRQITATDKQIDKLVYDLYEVPGTSYLIVPGAAWGGKFRGRHI